ncbi:fungal-specific transcription factor domain-containing protein [Mycena haematopus]|nr:fungal-specific transcription factor domain-containing protein [Mycena haematopus]
MSNSGRAAPKKRRLQGACDVCKKKKIRCDSSEMPGNKCSNCITFKTQCTHLYISKDGDSNSSSLNYKNSREHVAAILSQSTVYVPSSDPTVLFQVLVDIAKYARNLEELLAISSSTSLDLLSSPFGSNREDDDRSADSPREAEVSDDDSGVFVELGVIEPMVRLALRAPSSGIDEKYRFFGKSSNMNFIKTAMDGVNNLGDSQAFEAQRPEFWVVQPWHPAPESLPPLWFPEDDLLQSLIDIYFRRINPMLFLLHSPTFRASVVDGEHLRDQHFGAVVLAVCAVASKLSDDPRVLMATDAPLHSAGWKFFSQTRPLQLAALPHTADSQFRTLYNLQLFCLSVLFVSPSNTRACWVLSGLGIRLAQDIGAHRGSRYSGGSKTYAELLKRVFWILFTMDTLLNSVFGRPTVTTRDDCDVDLPTECDDEYWDEPHSFQQPPNKPALAAYMTSYLKLMLIFNRAHRSIYAVKRQKSREPAIVAELDSALNKWVDSIPSHLRWNPNREGIHLDQSASLYMIYYHVQIMIHRPFIGAPGETPTSDATFPSLAICANSARSCGVVMEVQSRRSGDILHHPHALTALFDSALILLINVWGSRQQRSSSDIIRAVADIKKCVDVLHLYESRYPAAGRKCDMITEMLNRASGNTLESLPKMSMKRRIPDGAEDDDVYAPIARTTTTASAVQQLEDLELSIQQTDHLFSLPLSTQELGLLPIYESFDFQFDFDPLQTPSPSLSATTNNPGLGFLPHERAYVNGSAEPRYSPIGDDFPQFKFDVPAAAPRSWKGWSSHYDTGHESAH